jgi:hypothetical protein
MYSFSKNVHAFDEYGSRDSGEASGHAGHAVHD